MNNKGIVKRVVKFVTDVLSWTCLCILVIVGACVVWYMVSAKIYAAKGEKYQPYFSLYTIISPSMEPHIKVYDVILDTRVDDVTKIKTGDVITFVSSGNLSNGMTITHRVIEVVKDGGVTRFRTKGDNNETPDGALVEPQNVLGKTLLRFPQLGRVQFLLAKKGGWVILIILPALGIIIYDLIKLFKMSALKEKVDNMLQGEEENEEEKRKKEEELKKSLKEKLSKKKIPAEDYAAISEESAPEQSKTEEDVKSEPVDDNSDKVEADKEIDLEVQEHIEEEKEKLQKELEFDEDEDI